MADEQPQTDEVKSPGAILSDAFYGGEPKGEPEPEPGPDPEVQPTDDPEPDVAKGEVDDDDVPEGDEDEVRTLEDLAAHLETDPEWLEGLSVTQKVNGKEISVPISEALATHRKVSAADEYLSDAKAKSKAMIDEAGQQQQEWAATIGASAQIYQELEQEYQKDLESVNWADLRKKDPAEHTAKRAEMKERREKLDGLKRKMQESVQTAAQRANEIRRLQNEQRLPQEREFIFERLPEWKDEKKFDQERNELIDYLTADGFSEQDIADHVYNGRLVALAVKAMRYDKSKTKAETKRKKVTKVPKILKPGSTQDSPKPTAADDENDPVKILYG